MRKKWFPFFLIILLVASPFTSVSEVYGMSDPSKEDEEKNDQEDRNKESDDEQDSSTGEDVSDEIKLEIGEDSEEVQELKEDLTELGFAALEKPTTYFGLHTEEAVKAFQTFYELEDTGIADEDTLLTIEYILSDDSFDREEHLEFSKPEEFVTEEEEVEELPEAEEIEEGTESAEVEESTEEEIEEGTESAEVEESTEEETEEGAESEEVEESTEEETEEGAESEEVEESTEEETEEGAETEETEESTGKGTEEGAETEETEESTGEGTEEGAETEESTGEGTEEGAETEEADESAGEGTGEGAETEEADESAGEGTEEGAETEESTEKGTGEGTESEQNQQDSIQNFSRATVFSVNGTYEKGDRHSDISDYKKKFNATGFRGITVTNYYGDYFEGQVKKFQEYYGLSVNGKIDQATKDQLDSVYNSPFKKGERHDDTPDIKRKLNNLGYSGISVTKLFGSYTEQKVKDFQRDQGLQVSGIVDEVTLAELNKLAPKDTYEKGDRHSDISDFKKKFNATGFRGITVTNYYGDYFEGQVKKFQKYYGLSVNGKIDQATKNQLDSVYNSSFQRGERHDDIPDIKEKLNSLGYSGISVTRLFGEYTEQKVKDFQRDQGLQVSGIVDEVTLAELNKLAPKDTYEKGDRHSEISDFKEKFNAIGFRGITVTNYYGDYFEGQVKKFQEYYGLSVNGKIDQATKDQLDGVYNSPFQRGERHDDTLDIKRKLNNLGYSGISVTKLFGEYTEQKVKNFQRDQGLQVSGIVDEVTLAELNKLAPKDTYEKGDRHSEISDFKEKFNAIGFRGITVTNYYGDYFEGQVKKFQEYYGLSVNGKIDQATKDQLDSVYNSPFQKGERHDDTPDIKRKLNNLGYSGISVTKFFGSYTEQKVKDFQRDQGLQVSGIVDEVTLAELNKLAPKDTYEKGDRHSDISDFKEKLNAIGFGGITVTNYYGSYFEGQVKKFQNYFDLSANGKIDKATKEKLDSVYNCPFQKGKRHSDLISIKENLNTLGYGGITVTTYFGTYMESQVKQFQRDNNLRVNGIVDEKTLAALDEAISNRWVVNHESYNVTLNQALNTQMNQLQQTDKYRNDAAYVHKNYVNGSNTTTANVNVRSSASNSSHIYGQLSQGTRVTILGSSGNWYRISYESWRNPTRSDVRSYLNPENNDIFQHLDLTSSVGVTPSSLNNDILNGKGILGGKGQAFITAGSRHDVNEIYLISHALLETGNGSSALATGIEVGLNSSGNPVVATSSNRSSLRNIRTTYNIYGIGAVDSNPRNGGAVRAYEEGWFSPEQAIIGGAEFIGNSYIHNSYDQNTLYKMRWNPANPGYPQYATDIGWAVKQVPSIKRLYDMLDNPVFNFNITQYR
ncbi:peptidoglycan-binding protein [Oceanobacillus locisalsi]|uniref:Peptidoglycan-binding protein n=1 Tax=Oceanobacillus locisalsi TaxID=546107 RepID=A0ABW3ND17_9BACI